jgi:menaquinone-dependent protoporphyrinogen oxidase
LVIHDSRYGSTQGIAEAVADVLTDRGHDVTVSFVKGAPDPSGFDAVVAGSPIYASRIRTGIVRYFEMHRATLATKQVALFAVSGTLAEETEANREAAEAALAPLRKGIDPTAIALFAGALDPKKLSWPARLLVRVLRAKTGDFRDWDRIRTWGAKLSDALESV